MVTYTYHGDGSVTVAPSEGQTGGSGFGSEGTYSSEQAARSAVSSGTREGAKENVELEAKRRYLESPTAQWASQEAYEAAYTSYMQAGGTPISHPAGIIPGSTPEERRAEAATYAAGKAAPQAPQAQIAASPTPILTGAMQRSHFDYTYGTENLPGIPGKEWLSKTREGKVLHVIPGEGYGWGYPEHVQEPGPMSSMFTPDSFTREVDAQLAATGKMISGLDVGVSKRLNLKSRVIAPVSDWYVKGERSLEKMGFKSDAETKKTFEEFSTGFGRGLAEKPVTTLGNVAIAFAVTKGMGALVSKAPVLAHGVGMGRITRHISAANVIGAGMVGLYSVDVGVRAMQSPRPVMTLGEITSTEIIPFGTGAYLGTKIKMSELLPKAKPAETPRFITDKEPVVDLRKADLKKVIETETWKDYEGMMKANRLDLIDKKYPTPEPKPVIKILPKTKPDKSLVLIPDKSPVYITGNEPVIDVRKAFTKHAIETETWKDYESMLKANRLDLIDKTYPTPEPKPVKQIRTIDLSKDLIKLKPDFSIPAPRKTYPYGDFSKLTDRLVTPGEELVPFPKAKLPETTKQGKVTILKDLNSKLRSKWRAEGIELDKQALKHGFFTSPEGQQVGTRQIQIQIQKQLPKTVSIPKAVQEMRTVSLEKDLIGLTALAVPIVVAPKSKQIVVMPKFLSRKMIPVISQRQQQQQTPKTTFKPIQVPRFVQPSQYTPISKIAQIPVMKPIQQMKQVEKTISKQVSKTKMRVPEMRPLLIPKFKLPGETQILRGRGGKRKISSYIIKNPFATLKDIIGKF